MIALLQCLFVELLLLRLFGERTCEVEIERAVPMCIERFFSRPPIQMGINEAHENEKKSNKLSRAYLFPNRQNGISVHFFVLLALAKIIRKMYSVENT